MTAYNPFDPSFADTEFDVLAKLREDGPVHEVMPGFFLVTRFADVRSVMRDAATFGQGGFTAQGMADIDLDDLTLGQSDPPFHTEIRRTMARTVTPRALTAFEPTLRQVADDLAREVSARPAADLTADVIGPFVARVTSLLAGMRQEDAEEIKQYASDFMFVQAAPDDPGVGAAVVRMSATRDRLRSAVLAARADPATASPMLSALLSATTSTGEPVSDRRVLTHLTADTIVAGLETTVNLLGNLFFEILQRDGLYARLREDEPARQQVIEESLRHDPPVNFLLRTARQAADVGGVAIPEGATVIVSLTSANRDDREFGDAASFDVDRSETLHRRHLAFGVGLHYCIGAPLARLEARCILDALLEHVPALSLEPGERYERVAFPIVRGPRHVKVIIG